MAAVNNDEYEPIRVPRPAGTPEWGAGGGGEEAPVKGKRREDRWV
jgi:cytochrome c oxidase assembly protein subunit 16